LAAFGKEKGGGGGMCTFKKTGPCISGRGKGPGPAIIKGRRPGIVSRKNIF